MFATISPKGLNARVRSDINPVISDYLNRNGKKILDIGCGKDKMPGSLGVDSNPRSDADIIHDLEAFPYPFPDKAFDEIRAISVIEHLSDVVATMEELHRITKTGGVLKILVPFFTSRYGFTDITHKHLFTSMSFDYFVPEESLGRYRYSDRVFKKLKVEYEPLPTVYRSRFQRPLVWMANRKKGFYENYLAHIFPLHDIYFELEVVR
ncbi:MAG: methyltransferase domain-containing protein [candidate division Zixibacteria bacterium]|nr:methyltransferase domain-containing protein [candidate division Zixibacteria bacterium]